MTRYMRRAAIMIFVTFMFSAALSYGQVAPENRKIPWKLTVVIMDDIDQREAAEIPVQEAVQFIESHTRFTFEVEYVKAPGIHGYTPYKVRPDPKRKRVDTVYAMMGWNVPKAVINRLPVSTSYLFLYKLFKRLPAQAGSALGLDFGLMKGGKPRTYATVPVDQWWYNNRPAQGFRHSAAQVLTHEIINTIQGKLEARPYRCGLLSGVSKAANKYEAERLAMITDVCYSRLGDNK
jgi:hypothetical protein